MRQGRAALHPTSLNAVCQKDVRGMLEGRAREVRRVLFALKRLRSWHQSSLRRSSWHGDLNILVVRGETSMRLPFCWILSPLCQTVPLLLPDALLRCLLPSLVLCFLPLPKPSSSPVPDTLRLLPHGFYRVKSTVTAPRPYSKWILYFCVGNSASSILLSFFPLIFSLSLFWETHSWGTGARHLEQGAALLDVGLLCSVVWLGGF